MSVQAKLKQRCVCQPSPGPGNTGVSVWVYNASSTACTGKPCAYVQCLNKGWSKKDTHINTQKFRGSHIIFRQTSLFSEAVLSPNCSVCSCVRLRCFTTRLHCQSACLIGCTPARTTTLSSSSWCYDLSSAEERTLSETLNTTQKFTDFCQCLWCRGICRRKGCFVRSCLTKVVQTQWNLYSSYY